MDERNDKMEGLLRRWGDEQSARAAQVGQFTFPDGRAAAMPRSPWRWAPLAAAAVALVAAGVMLVVALNARNGAAGLREEAALLTADKQRLDGQLDELHKQLAAAQDDLKVARNSLTGAEASTKAADDYTKQQENRVAELTGELAKAAAGQVQAQKDLAAARLAADKLTTELAAKDEELKAKADAIAKVADEAKLDAKRVAVATEELKNVRAMHDQAMATARQAKADLAAARAEQNALMAEIQRVYLMLPAGVEPDLRARQAAAARSPRMLERYSDLKKEIRSGPARQVAGKIEIVLTRLELLDPVDPASAGELSKMVRDGNLVSQIDDVLSTGPEPAAVRAWLVEAKLILMGA